MPGALAEVIAVAALLGVLAFTVVGPARLPEAVVGVPAAGLLIALGIVSPAGAWDEIRSLGPTVGFLGAVLVLAHLCDREGVFTALGHLLARGTGHGTHRGPRLLAVVFAAASVVTAVLSLDATVVLLTPVVLLTARALRVPDRPHVFACAHLANSASLLLPVSNLTNLIVLADADISFGRFTALMTLPWLVVIAVEFGVFRRFFAADLAPTAPLAAAAEPPIGMPVVPIAVVALTLAGFAVCSLIGAEPWWAATAGALVLGTWSLAHRRAELRAAVASANVTFLIFVLALGVVVRGVEQHGLGSVVRRVVPGHAGLGELALMALIGAVLACAVNNLPAILMLSPTLTAQHQPGLVLAALIGVNVGPNAVYVGSLATMLWRRVLRRHDTEPSMSSLFRLGALTVPASMASGVLALWLSLHAVGI